MQQKSSNWMHQRLRLRQPGPHDSSASTSSFRVDSTQTQTRPNLHSKTPPNLASKTHLNLANRLPSKTSHPSPSQLSPLSSKVSSKPGVNVYLSSLLCETIYTHTVYCVLRAWLVTRSVSTDFLIVSHYFMTHRVMYSFLSPYFVDVDGKPVSIQPKIML